MRVLVTGSAGHLGEGLVRTLRGRQHEVVGLDLLDSPFTTHVGSILDHDFVRRCLRGIDLVIHTATLHTPHVATHPRHAFVEINIAGTLAVLEAALGSGVAGVVYSSTTSAFGAALRPADGQPAAWVNEDVHSVPKNIYGVTKKAAEDLCELFCRSNGLPCIILRTARFFPETDDDPDLRELTGQRLRRLAFAELTASDPPPATASTATTRIRPSSTRSDVTVPASR